MLLSREDLSTLFLGSTVQDGREREGKTLGPEASGNAESLE